MSDPKVLGRELTEQDAFRNMIEALRVCESCARIIAFQRQDPRWFMIQNAFEGNRDMVTKMMNAPFEKLIHQFTSRPN